MKILELIKEVFRKYRGLFIKSRMKKTWKENMFLIPLFLAVIVFIIILAKIFVPAEWL